jgi:hypothetical protein
VDGDSLKDAGRSKRKVNRWIEEWEERRWVSGIYIKAVLKVGSSNSVYENSIKCIIFER